MAVPREARGGRVLLFDRLTDPSPGTSEVYPFILYNKTELKDSLRRELEKLLSTRHSYSMAELSGQTRTTISYGIPDGANITPADPGGRSVLARAITEAIRAFEPRLENPAVTLRLPPGRGDMLIAEISGQLAWQNSRETVNFTVPLDSYDEHR